MATITFKTKDLERDLGGIDRLDERISDYGMEIEEQGKEEMTFDISPNRPDMLDYNGFVRALGYFSGKEPELGKYDVGKSPALTVTVTPAVRRIRPYIAAMVVKGANLKGDRLKYLINFTEKFSITYGRRRKKIAMGLHNLEAVKGDLVYDAAANEKFVPLGTDREMTFGEILEQHNKGIEYADTVAAKGKRGRAIYPYLRDSEKILSMIPIINSKATEVRDSMSSLLIDVTGTDERTVEKTLDILACSFIDSGCKVLPCRILYNGTAMSTPLLKERTIGIRAADAAKTIGVGISAGDIPGYLGRMGYEAKTEGKKVSARVPPYRLDVINEQDVIEDIAIGYGYRKIIPRPIVAADFSGAPHPNAEVREALDALMLGLGYTEALNTVLTNEDINFSRMGRKQERNATVSVARSKTEAISMLRTSIMPQLLQNLGISTSERMPQRLFEIGSVFRVDNGKVVEEIMIGFLGEHSKANLAEARTVLNYITGRLGMKATIERGSDPSMIEGRCGAVLIGGKRRGIFGELHPEALSKFGIEEPVVGGELIINADAMR